MPDDLRQASAPLVLPLDAEGATLEMVGGKGASLASMAMAGLPVPAGFHLTTAAYRRFVDANHLHAGIEEALRGATSDDPATLERAAAAIHALFQGGALPDDIAVAIRHAYAGMDEHGPAVAVRSSATAEDLPALSFAGQQETFLNVRGEAALLEAVRRCWASLWTARAIGYRQRVGVDQRALAMGVVVQRMMPAECAGVLFTANPTTGERGELVVNASFGLGEGIVSGQVTPDVYVVDKTRLATKETAVGEKEIMVVPAAGQGTEMEAVSDGRRTERTLSDASLREIAALGVRVEEHFGGVPQDVEWAVAKGRCWLLQARPITRLPPAPLAGARWEPPEPGTAWIRRQVVENMPGPLSPLFADLYLPSLDDAIHGLYAVMGVPSAAGSIVARPIFATVNGYAYMRASLTWRWTVLPALVRAMAGIPWMFRGQGITYWRDEALPSYLAAIESWKRRDSGAATDEDLLEGVRELASADAVYWGAVSLAVGTAKVSEDLLNRFLSHAAPGLTSGLYLRGFPSKTLESQAELEAIAERIRASAELAPAVAGVPAERLPEALAATPEGRAVVDALDGYLDRFGHQIYTLDFAEPTQADDPLPVLLSLKIMASRPHRPVAARLEDLARERDEAAARTAESLPPIRRRLFRRLLRLAQRFAPYREEALFYIGAAWPTLRRLALELGRRLAAAGSLGVPDDVFFLTADELTGAILARAADRARPELARLARERGEVRKAQGRLHPPAAVPPDFRWKLGPIDLSGRETQMRNPKEALVMRGFGVSPGQVSAPASVIFSAAEFQQMESGSILVCPTTTPAWTPLFAQARGLVTDVGGILAHGSIVAREYGIPAVMGTGNATQRIATGQRVTVDGNAGTVTLTE